MEEIWGSLIVWDLAVNTGLVGRAFGRAAGLVPWIRRADLPGMPGSKSHDEV